MTEFLQDILMEAACSSLAVPPCKSMTVEAMWLFGNYPMTLPLCVAAFGVLVGCMFSYGAGVLLDVLRQKHQETINIQHYDAARPYVLRFISPLMLIYWVGPFTAVSLVLGFFRMRWWAVALLVLCGAALRVAWMMRAHA